ncbi:hypothetical protein OG978_45835 (plasmid) [Streptomyces sp. NBC_01591]|uniref:hypothetical protein n=1 Tax=Streptomyces sp. NBC_01591 TaxID=2975888 RepID=UPI002DDC2A4D|nr:hypothetical protein [Streptomyces sp. NBC_01591]WSD74379.1 hypothetical protein OG978_45835 [Streptomyces sp. NBC_01591]
MLNQAHDEQRQEQTKESVVSSIRSLLLIVPALLLLRFLGEHAWAYWSAAAIGGLGAVLAAFDIVNQVRLLLLRRRGVTASVWVVLVLIAGIFALGVRLI